ncbi:head completion/stabilization protein [Comamonas resistens]|uniref:head completion/stabilization protein n=1 Tax=Comamonas resistens TaxID=3046670 RepID=UPI0039BC9BB6
MNSFVFPANPPKPALSPAVTNDGWWPDIDLVKLRADCRLDGTVTEERLRRSVINAVAEINRQLGSWKTVQIEAGCVSLLDVQAPQIDGKSVKFALYLRAVGAAVQADMAEAYRDISTLPDGANKQDRVLASVDVRADGFLRDMRWAIADLKDQRRVIVELI